MTQTKYSSKAILIIALFIIPLNWAWAEEPLFFPTTEEEIINALKVDKMRGLNRIDPENPPKVGALIHFDYNSADIMPESYPLLHRYGRVLQQALTDATLVIAGHTDNMGPKLYNIGLSYQRALSVKTFLTQYHQIAEYRLIIKAHGESQPIDSNRTESGRARNRRVEFMRIE
jgi:outer membrane protein OmpA-like peptidoglycan-associated protein